jgi:hypothetical protein
MANGGGCVTGTKKKSYLLWCGLLVVFLLAWLPRLFYPVSRYTLWYERSVHFWDALLAGDWGGTYQRQHPGVTTMWIAGLGIRVYMVTQGWSSYEVLHPPKMLAGPQGPPAQAGVITLSLVIAACIALAYIVLIRLANWPVAFSAGCLLALDPFYITHSKMIHVDGLLAGFMLVSVLFLVSYLQRGKLAYLIFSAIFAGLAFLTKSPSWFLIPYAALIVALHHLTDRGGVSVDSSRGRVWRGRLWATIRSLSIWGLVVICVFSLLWPAMWVKPGEVISKMGKKVVHHISTAHPNPSFFSGQVVHDDPGPLYYMATLGWKTTVITLPATCVAILLLIRRKCEGDCKPLWYVLIYASGFLLSMMFGAKKWSRYILPTIIALDVLAAWGLVHVASIVGKWVRLRKRTLIPSAIVATALVTQAVTVLGHHPYYGTHHNSLLGGSRVAQHILPLGDQGEGLDLAARFLNSRPGAELLTAGASDKENLMFRSNFVGDTQSIENLDVDYRVFFINQAQRDLGTDLWKNLREACQQAEPVWSVSFDGVPYVWICRAYPYSAEAFAIDHPLDVRLGDHIRLLGYHLDSSSLSAGETLIVTLFWQSDDRLIEDYHVFVHLLNADESLVTQHDGVPVQGERPSWSWQDAEVLQDEHMLVTDSGLPDGTYTLSIGMYEYLSGVRLPAVGPAGERLPEDRIVLQDIQVTSP